jgi:fatty-acyl-CoA synthase
VVVYHLAFAATLAEVVGDLHDVQVLVHVEDGSGGQPLDGSIEYEGALASTEPMVPRSLAASWSADDLYLCYTGGTTGAPKGVLWRQADFLVAALGVRRRDGRDIESFDELAEAAPMSGLRALPAPPLMHGAAHWNAMSCWAAGGTVVIQDRPDRLDPADVLGVAARERATSLLIVGDPFARPLLDEIARARDPGCPYDLSAMRHLLSGGAVLSPQVKTELIEAIPGVTVVDVLGSTESGRQGVSQVRDPHDQDAGFEPSPTAVVLSEDRSRLLEPGDTRSAGWPRRVACPSATSATRRRPAPPSRWSAACVTRSPVIVHGGARTAPSSSSAGSRSRSTPAARRCSRRRSRRR